MRHIYNVVGAIGSVRGGAGLTGDLQSLVDALIDWSIDLGFDVRLLADDHAPGTAGTIRE